METLQTAYMPPAPTVAALELGRRLFTVCRSALAVALNPSPQSLPSAKPARTPTWRSYAVYSGALSVRKYKSIGRNP
jgi:hypothetical protein